MPWQTYCGPGSNPASWLAAWNFDPVLLGVMAGALALGWTLRPETRPWQAGAAAAMMVLFVSPFCALGAALFSARAVHHMALVFVLAPLIAKAVGVRADGIARHLALLTGIQALAFWGWHLPQAYSAALSSHAVFWAMQLSITLSAAVWWLAVARAQALAAGAALLANMVQMGLLGALIVFAARPLYAPHALTTGPWGLSPLEDQQIAGLVMWVVGGGAFLLIAAVILYRALALPAPERAAPA